MWSDPINQKNPVRIVLYQNPQVWGECELLASGRLPRVEPEDADLRLQGPIPLRIAVPSEATRFSLVIEDASGRRIRNLASHASVDEYRTEPPPRDATAPSPASPGASASISLEVPWDGRADGEWNAERQVFVGDVVAPGSYTVRGIWHRGLGVVHAGSFYDPGTPPWPTANGTGAWGFDHSNPHAVAAMPRDATTRGRVFLGWHQGECGVGFIGLDANGRKIWEWLRRGTGATHIATNSQHAFFCFDGDGGTARLGKVQPDTGEQIPFGIRVMDLPLPGKPTGLAARGIHLLVSVGAANKVVWLNADSGDVQHEFGVPGAGSLAFISDDQFLVTGTEGPALGSLRTRALDRLKNPGPGAVALTAETPLAFGGTLYVGDRNSATVKVLRGADSPGQVLGTIGVPGGHVPGPWNPQRMNRPRAIAVEERADGTTQVWVVEDSHSPRRISVWTPEGNLVRDYLGNTRYSASGGFLSDDVPDLGFVDGVSYRIDYATSDYRPIDVLGGQPAPRDGKSTPFTLGKGAGNFANPCHFFSDVSGRECEYLIEAGGTHPMVFMKRGDRWQCVAALGPASHAAGLPTSAPGPGSVFSWNDLDGDGYPSENEIAWHDVGRPNVLAGGWGYRCGRDLTFYHSGLAFRPVRFLPDGAPVYDVTRAEKLPGDLGNVKGDIHKTRFGYFGSLPSGHDVDRNNVIHGLHQLAGFDASGRLRWTYPNYWVAVHGAFTAPMAMPGVLMGILKTTGVISGAEHDVISLRGNIGQEFLIRDDGVYVGELFTDQRMAPATLPPEENIRGLPINDTTLGGEPFNGWIGRQRDGRVRMTYGYTDVRIAEVIGLDGVASLAPQTITLGAEEIALAKSFVPKKGLGAAPTSARIARGGAFSPGESFEGKLKIRQGREELGVAQLRWDDQNLYLAVQASDTTPLQNKGNSAPLAFKTGDSVSLFVAPAAATTGGTRVLLTRLAGQLTAVVYRPNGPGDSPYVFESPIRKSPFQHVAVEPAIRISAQPGTTDYQLTAIVPWTVFGIRPEPGLTLRGDIALLFSDETGAATAQRVHWVDRETNVVNDTPTEAEFSPARWGTWTLDSPDGAKTSPPGANSQSSAPPPGNIPASREGAEISNRGWKTVYRESFDELPNGLKTADGALSGWEGGSALGVVRDGGRGSTSGKYLGQVTAWQHFNFGPVFNLDLKDHPHTHVRVRFTLYTFGEWRGLHGKGSPHSLGFWDSRATHPFSRYFALATVPGEKQSFPDVMSSGTHPAATGATLDDAIDLAPDHGNDHRWPMSFEYVTGSDSLRFAMLSGWHSLGGPPMPEPTFGIDDVHVEVLDARSAAVPGADLSPPLAISPKPPGFRWGTATTPGQRGKTDLRFTLDSPGYVTLAIENSDGVRVRNLIGETRFEAGEHVIGWDGLDETCRNFRVCGVYDLAPQPVPPGRYHVRGLVRGEIDARYELTVNNAGNPPWPRQDGTGRWLADHSPPSDVLFLPPGRTEHRGFARDASFHRGDAEFIPTEEPLVLVASHVAESGDGLVWCDLDGRKRRGIRSLGAGGGWCGAERLARDRGPSADTSIYAFAATGWKNALELRALPSGDVLYSSTFQTPADLSCQGLAVHNRLVAFTIRPSDLLVLVDTVTRRPIGTIPLKDPGGVAFDESGSLYVVTDRQVIRLEGLELGKVSANAAGMLDLQALRSVTVVSHTPEGSAGAGLSDPRQLLFSEGELFVADHGTAHQVKVFDAAGTFLRTIGRPGGMKLGAYSAESMQKPSGMTIDSRGRLWVAESDYSPKRVSVWSRAGQFETAFYGPPGYGGGGSLDPLDPTRFYLAYGSGLEFQIDWRTRHSVPVHRYWMDSPNELRLGADWHAAPQTPIVVEGRRYMTNAFSNSPGGFGSVVGIWRIENGLAVPAACAGAFADWPPLQAEQFRPLVPENTDPRRLFFVWSDVNGDQRPQVEEVSTAMDDGIQHNNGKHVGGVYVAPDLSLTTAFGLHVKPQRYTDKGVPVYETARLQRLVRQLEFHWVPYDSVTSAEGWFITKAEPLRGFRNGKLMWTYPNLWPELHACLREPPPLPQPGQFIGTMRWLGHPVTPRGSDVGEIFALTGYYGRISLMTADGLCVGSLFQDARATGYFNAFESVAAAEPGTRMNSVSLQTECFFDTLTQLPDGRIYLQAGKSQCNLVRLDGLESLRRIPEQDFELK